MTSRTLSDVVVAGVPGRNVVIRDGVIASLDAPPEGEVLDGCGAVVVPGFHDHHCHLLATARAVTSVQLDGVRDLGVALAAPGAARGGWIRAVGFSGDLDRETLDAVSPPGVRVRVQHRGGSAWFLNSAAIEGLGLDSGGPEGVERVHGRATGRLWRSDRWLGEQDTGPAQLDLPALGHRLASYGVTGVSDATPDLDAATKQRLVASLPQRVTFLNKLVVSDHALPGTTELAERVREARRRGPVAIHAVTADALWLTLAALADAGTVPGDRIEHAAVAPPEAIAQIGRLGLVVCTQPSLIARRGDDYLAEIEEDQRPHLWRHRSFLAQGVPVLLASDAPYGDPDPGVTIRAATERRTPRGIVLGESERVTESEAWAGFLAAPTWPHAQRRVGPGEPADLVLMKDGAVRATLVDGVTAYDSG